MMRISMMTDVKQAPSLPILIFVALNMADAWLTQQLLAHDGIEMFWWSASFNADILIKGILALLIAFFITRLDRPHLLKWLITGMVFVVLSNGICYMGYLGSSIYWQTQIATYP